MKKQLNQTELDRFAKFYFYRDNPFIASMLQSSFAAHSKLHNDAYVKQQLAEFELNPPILESVMQEAIELLRSQILCQLKDAAFATGYGHSAATRLAAIKELLPLLGLNQTIKVELNTVNSKMDFSKLNQDELVMLRKLLEGRIGE